jgi:hypothetical protein
VGPDGGAPDGGAQSAGMDGGMDGGSDGGLRPPYPSDRTYSPLTPEIVANLQRIASRGAGMHDDVFAKVGDSITVASSFLQCFAGSFVDLGTHGDLAPAVAYFRSGDAAGTNPYQRVSLTATVGWSATSAVAGNPSPLDQEIAAISPRFAVVMYGTNDVGARTIWQYADAMLTIVDDLLGKGILPALSSVPPRDDDAAANLLVPRFNEVVRGIAQGRQIPFMDFHRELMPLPAHGLGPDHVHPNTYLIGGAARPCVLTPDGLQFGYNVRNLLTMQTLSRMHAALQPGATAPDAPLSAPAGDGSPEHPFEIESLPFSDMRDTTRSPNSRFSTYTGCAATQNESGPEFVYRFTTATPVTVRALVFDQGTVDIDVHLLSAPSPDACLQRNDRELVATLMPGTYYFSLDTFVGSDGVAHPGEYLFLLLQEP